jgi:hypothetical protein
MVTWWSMDVRRYVKRTFEFRLSGHLQRAWTEELTNFSRRQL